MTSQDTAFMGFYAVAPKYQGKGIGRELWSHTVARLSKPNHNIGLYGVPAMTEKYNKSGFKMEDSIRMLIFESQPGQVLNTGELKCLKDVQENCDYCNDLIVVKLGGSKPQKLTKEHVIQFVDELIQYDAEVNKFCRKDLLRNYLINASETPLTISIVKIERTLKKEEKVASAIIGDEQSDVDEGLSENVKSSLKISSGSRWPSEHKPDVESESTYKSIVVGYGCIRHDNTGGAMIGPLYAQSSDLCEVILRQLIEDFDMKPGGKYSVMSLTSNEKAEKIMKQIGLQEMDQCSRLFTKFIPKASFEQIYYVHSPNFSLF